MSSVDQPQDGVFSNQRPNARHQAAAEKPAPDTEQGELRVEELEERIAPKLAANHNETLLA